MREILKQVSLYVGCSEEQKDSNSQWKASHITDWDIMDYNICMENWKYPKHLTSHKHICWQKIHVTAPTK
jgi:hypothetical protein